MEAIPMLDGWTDVCMDMDGWMDGWMEGWRVLDNY